MSLYVIYDTIINSINAVCEILILFYLVEFFPDRLLFTNLKTFANIVPLLGHLYSFLICALSLD